MIISKNKNHLQRQLFIVFTDYLSPPQLFELGDELRLDLGIVTLEKDHCKKHEIKDKTLPVGVRPVAIYKKISPAIKQTYNLPLNGTIYNYFQILESLLKVCIFSSDIVVDTTLDGKNGLSLYQKKCTYVLLKLKMISFSTLTCASRKLLS
ncbi:uncharacterized protein LOC144638678 [Oculina patagonica]